MRRDFAWAALAALGYTLLSWAAFTPPATLADAEACGFVAADFAADGRLAHAPFDAWWIAFLRQQDYWTALSVALAVGFAVYALQVGRRAGAARAAGAAKFDGATAGAAAGGGLLALSALCVSCIAPVLSAVGLGLAGSLLAGLPKWLIALNTLLLTGWGRMFLSRRSTTCPLPPPRKAAGPANPVTTPR